MDQAKRGADALAAQDSLTALTAYTKALLQSPFSPDYWTQRSTAFTRLKPPRHDLALQDAETAVLCARKRGPREKILAAQQRRAIALFSLKQYHDAAFLFDVVKKLTPTQEKAAAGELYGKNDKAHAQVDMWRIKVGNKFKAMSEQELAQVPEITVKEVPDSELPGEKEMKAKLREQLKSDDTYAFDGEEDLQPKLKAQPASNGHPQGTESEGPSSTQKTAATTAQPPAAQDSSTGLSKIRHEWFQNSSTVMITIYAKGVSKDKAEIAIEEDSFAISFPHPSDPTATYEFSLDPLYTLIDAAASSYAVMSTKIEIKLQKTSGVKWAALEGTAPLRDKSNTTTQAIPASILAEDRLPRPTESAPPYPTSSRNGPKNWDKLAKDLTSKPKKENKTKDRGKQKEKIGSSSEEDNDNVEDEYDSDLESAADPADGFFKKLFKNSDPDTQRAMQKSFLESNGTTLSTNWAEVGAGRVKPYESKKDDD